jgi:type II secretory pathway pseudopilin PulG
MPRTTNTEGEEVTAVVIMFGVVATVAVIMLGAYMIARVHDDATFDKRDALQQLQNAQTDNQDLRREVAGLKLDLATERNRIHSSDQQLEEKK